MREELQQKPVILSTPLEHTKNEMPDLCSSLTQKPNPTAEPVQFNEINGSNGSCVLWHVT